MATSTSILIAKGIQNPQALIAAAHIAGVPLWVAAAFAQKESGGRNVYGNDVGGTFATPGAPDKAVTATNYAEFYRLVVDLGAKSNGVGPMQITYRAYFPQAKSQGLRLWTPFENYLFGLRIIAKSLAGSTTVASLQRAGTLYNAGNLTNGINTYGYDVAKKAASWKTALTGSTAPATLKRGSTGNEVKWLQEGLMLRFPTYASVIKASGGADGKFGPVTESVVKQFQTRVGIGATGVVDAWTRGHLSVHRVTW